MPLDDAAAIGPDLLADSEVFGGGVKSQMEKIDRLSYRQLHPGDDRGMVSGFCPQSKGRLGVRAEPFHAGHRSGVLPQIREVDGSKFGIALETILPKEINCRAQDYERSKKDEAAHVPR
jgi:hypothetical protein